MKGARSLAGCVREFPLEGVAEFFGGLLVAQVLLCLRCDKIAPRGVGGDFVEDEGLCGIFECPFVVAEFQERLCRRPPGSCDGVAEERPVLAAEGLASGITTLIQVM